MLVRDGSELVRYDESIDPDAYHSVGSAAVVAAKEYMGGHGALEVSGGGKKADVASKKEDLDDIDTLDEPVSDTIIASALGQAATGKLARRRRQVRMRLNWWLSERFM